jgi:hypothetical protein
MNNAKIAAAVALALGGASAAHATTVAQCTGTSTVTNVYVAGSSAAQAAFATALNSADAFNGSELTFSASNGNFKAYCGVSANSKFATVGNTVVVHYRAEGGSVVGALPIASTTQPAIKFLDLTNASVTALAVTTTGTSAANGTTDTWGGPLTGHIVEIGVTDVEPGQFVGSNYPTAYSTTAFGTASATALASLSKNVIFGQVFGLYVNTSGFNGLATTGQAVDLTRETAASILTGGYTDWSKVPTASGGVVSSTPVNLTLINREAGSGTRTGASIYFLGYNCSQKTNPIVDTALSPPDGFATGDVLTTASTTAGGITYASIDNSKANLNIATLSGVTPSNLAATSGAYDWWFEAQLIKNPSASVPAFSQSLYTFLSGELSAVNTAPHTKQILAVPNAGVPANTAVAPVVANTFGGATTPIYINPFTRLSNSCLTPVSKN